MNHEEWLKELCPEIADWQIEVIAEQMGKAVAAEREECARTCEEMSKKNEGHPLRLYGFHEAEWCANAIRARGEK